MSRGKYAEPMPGRVRAMRAVLGGYAGLGQPGTILDPTRPDAEEWRQLYDPDDQRQADIDAIVRGTLGVNWMGHERISGPFLAHDFSCWND